MKQRIDKGLILVLSLALWLGASAQDETRDNEAPAADAGETAQEHGSSSDATLEGEDEGEAQPSAESDPLADLESEEAADGDRETAATMERFRPTEKISEDRSVAFPNDI